ncbi:MAG: DUF3100 domain-containing protein [Mycoplasmatales bacterium]
MNKNFKYFLLYVPVIVIIAELIGKQLIKITDKITIFILPLLLAVAITMIIGSSFFRKGIIRKIYDEQNINFASKYLILIILPLMAKYGADIAPKLEEIMRVGWVFLFQELGNSVTVILGMPIAILIGLKRSAIGATLGIGREGELAYISEKYTLDSDEGKGVLGLYLFGTLFGAIFFGIVAPLFLNLGFDVRALAMASGVGSGSMMSASSAALVAAVPDQEATILSYAATSQLLTSTLGTYTMLFVAIPLQKLFYEKLTRQPYELGVKND